MTLCTPHHHLLVPPHCEHIRGRADTQLCRYPGAGIQICRQAGGTDKQTHSQRNAFSHTGTHTYIHIYTYIYRYIHTGASMGTATCTTRHLVRQVALCGLPILLSTWSNSNSLENVGCFMPPWSLSGKHPANFMNPALNSLSIPSVVTSEEIDCLHPESLS